MTNPANVAVPYGTLPWRLTAAAPGDLDLLIDVQAPVSWDIGSGESGRGRVTEPICGGFPVLTTRGNSQGRKSKFTFFLPDTDARDDVEAALVAAKNSRDVPYYTFSAVDGGASWNVQFDPKDQLTVAYLAGHRVIQASLLQVGTSLTLPASPEPPVTGNPSLWAIRSDGGDLKAMINSDMSQELLLVSWQDMGIPAPDDFIALEPVGGAPGSFGRISLGMLSNGINAPMRVNAWTTLPVRLVAHVYGPTQVIGPAFTLYAPQLVLRWVTDAGPFPQFRVDWDGFPGIDAVTHIYVTPAATAHNLSTAVLSIPASGTSGMVEAEPVPPILGLPSTYVPIAVVVSGAQCLGTFTAVPF